MDLKVLNKIKDESLNLAEKHQINVSINFENTSSEKYIEINFADYNFCRINFAILDGSQTASGKPYAHVSITSENDFEQGSTPDRDSISDVFEDILVDAKEWIKKLEELEHIEKVGELDNSQILRNQVRRELLGDVSKLLTNDSRAGSIFFNHENIRPMFMVGSKKLKHMKERANSNTYVEEKIEVTFNDELAGSVKVRQDVEEVEWERTDYRNMLNPVSTIKTIEPADTKDVDYLKKVNKYLVKKSEDFTKVKTNNRVR